MKVLIGGAAGMLGTATVREGETRGHEVTAVARPQVDVTVDDQVGAVIGRVGPDVVINCTAYNRVDDAEDEPSVALAVHAWAVRSLARAATSVGAILVHYSTDFVFDGTGPSSPTSRPMRPTLRAHMAPPN